MTFNGKLSFNNCSISRLNYSDNKSLVVSSLGFYHTSAENFSVYTTSSFSLGNLSTIYYTVASAESHLTLIINCTYDSTIQSDGNDQITDITIAEDNTLTFTQEPYNLEHYGYIAVYNNTSRTATNIRQSIFQDKNGIWVSKLQYDELCDEVNNVSHCYQDFNTSFSTYANHSVRREITLMNGTDHVIGRITNTTSSPMLIRFTSRYYI